ncbi:MAG: bifunctional adenosylcobinamide kinase/adenosylcobinamide-phosphate guanylyltransferase [Lentisphaeria bacterium]|nr:bifunctional adenosylcobinamide kinase/adenosylcobinamide-phosphate guanylyltransferase [Lentisphaeria bacterium]
MNKIILVTGGARSGKSVFAEKCTADYTGNRVYIATAHIMDEEMKQRVKLHQERRAGNGWFNIEEEYDIASALKQAERQHAGAALVDCLTVWINNLMFRDESFNEKGMIRETDRLLTALKHFPGLTVLVLNEVGQGIVPENASARIFRDCSGRCGQMIAAAADEVWYCVCGIPMKIKG